MNKTHYLSAFKFLTHFNNWIIVQLNQLMAISRLRIMVEEKMAQHIEENLKNNNHKGAFETS